MVNRLETIRTEIKQYGFDQIDELYYNLSYDELFKHETDPSLEGFSKGFVTNTGAVTVDTGIFTGRSPKDKYIVEEETSKENIWWKTAGRKSSDNKPVSEEVWTDLYGLAVKQLNGKKLYVMDGFAGANPDTRLKIRVITEVAWMAHFVKNMFIRPEEHELENFTPDFVMLNACKTNDPEWEKHKLNSEVFVVFNLKKEACCCWGYLVWWRDQERFL